MDKRQGIEKNIAEIKKSDKIVTFSAKAAIKVWNDCSTNTKAKNCTGKIERFLAQLLLKHGIAVHPSTDKNMILLSANNGIN